MNKGPSIQIYACGGAGINITNSYKGDNGDITLLDTSFANVVTKEQDVITLSRKKEGGGKIRSKNSSEIDENIKELGDIYSDINILLYSTSGASGSVIGPLLNKYINSYNKKIINCIVVSDDSNTEIENTLNTIKSLDAIAKREKIFMPIIIFKNTNKYTQKNLNISIASRLLDIYNFFSVETKEIDKNDRLNFISDHDNGYGLRPMSIIFNKFEKHIKEILDDIVICNSFKNNDEDLILFHSYMGIGYVKENGENEYPIPNFSNNEEQNIEVSIKTKYEGVQILEEGNAYVSVIYPTDILLKNLVQELETKLLKFNNLKSKNKDSLFDEDMYSPNDTGLVL